MYLSRMGRKRKFTIKESLKELKMFKPKVDNYRSCKRLAALILIKENTTASLAKISEKLNTNPRTLDTWIKIYKTEGINKLLARDTRKKTSKIITPEIHRQLKQKLHSRENPFSGYVEVQEWLESEHGVKITYQWLWKYMNTKLDSRLKKPRRVNIKKEDGAEDSFFKTALHTETD